MSRALHRWVLAAVCGCLLLGGITVRAEECTIYGTVVAEPSDRPDLGNWRYRLLINWDTGSQYALSHMDVFLDEETGACTCADFAAALRFPDPVGSAMGAPAPCMMTFYPELNCGGDPSIPGVAGKVLKFEPYENESCEPGTYGVGSFTIYSDLGPAPISEPNLFLVDKFGQLACWGNLSGMFPALPCNPVGDTPSTWGSLKAVYR